MGAQAELSDCSFGSCAPAVEADPVVDLCTGGSIHDPAAGCSPVVDCTLVADSGYIPVDCVLAVGDSDCIRLAADCIRLAAGVEEVHFDAGSYQEDGCHFHAVVGSLGFSLVAGFAAKEDAEHSAEEVVVAAGCKGWNCMGAAVVLHCVDGAVVGHYCGDAVALELAPLHPKHAFQSGSFDVHVHSWQQAHARTD